MVAATSLVATVLIATSFASGPGQDPPGTSARGDEPIRPVQPAPRMDARKVALGTLLFSDTRLSGDNRLACSSCHDLTTNGAAAQTVTRVPGRAPPTLNTPTVFNAATNFRLGWRGTFHSLESQTASLLESQGVMHADISVVVERLRQDPLTNRRFRGAYGRPPDREALLDAIASFERTLVTPDGRFDLWLQGDDTALTDRELRGYRTFKAIGCIACHQGTNIGGNLFQRSGIFTPATQRGTPVLRVPSLRNVATTAPYFHDGSAATLPEAVQAMGRSQLGVTLEAADIADITAFLHTLTGRHDGRQLKAPGT